MKKTFVKIILTVCLMMTFLPVFGRGSLIQVVEPVLAQDGTPANNPIQTDSTNYARAGMNDLASRLGLRAEEGDLVSKIAGFVKMILIMLGGALLVLFLYAGFLRMFSMGNAEKIKSSNDIMVSAVVGLLIISVSYIFVNWLVTELSKF